MGNAVEQRKFVKKKIATQILPKMPLDLTELILRSTIKPA